MGGLFSQRVGVGRLIIRLGSPRVGRGSGVGQSARRRAPRARPRRRIGGSARGFAVGIGSRRSRAAQSRRAQPDRPATPESSPRRRKQSQRQRLSCESGGLSNAPHSNFGPLQSRPPDAPRIHQHSWLDPKVGGGIAQATTTSYGYRRDTHNARCVCTSSLPEITAPPPQVAQTSGWRAASAEVAPTSADIGHGTIGRSRLDSVGLGPSCSKCGGHRRSKTLET